MRKGRRVARLPPCPLPRLPLLSTCLVRRFSSDLAVASTPIDRFSIFLFSLSLFLSLSVRPFSLPLRLSREKPSSERSFAARRRSFFIRRYDLSPGVNGRLDQPWKLSFFFSSFPLFLK